MASSGPFVTQIQNRNYLSGIGFKFNLAKHPKVDFLSNSARIPEVNLATAIQSTYLKDIDIPGEKLTYGDFTLKFLRPFSNPLRTETIASSKVMPFFV